MSYCTVGFITMYKLCYNIIKYSSASAVTTMTERVYTVVCTESVLRAYTLQCHCQCPVMIEYFPVLTTVNCYEIRFMIYGLQYECCIIIMRCLRKAAPLSFNS